MSMSMSMRVWCAVFVKRNVERGSSKREAFTLYCSVLYMLYVMLCVGMLTEEILIKGKDMYVYMCTHVRVYVYVYVYIFFVFVCVCVSVRMLLLYAMLCVIISYYVVASGCIRLHPIDRSHCDMARVVFVRKVYRGVVYAACAGRCER